MIPKDFINEWREHAPWRLDAQVEQDLVISRALVDMYSVPEVRERLAFRGGTALYKLHFRPPARYSEDIDLVQVEATPIGETLDIVRGVLDPWLGTPQRKFKEGRVNLVYRFESEDSPPFKMRLKIEINTREHFTEIGLSSEGLRSHARSASSGATWASPRASAGEASATVTSAWIGAVCRVRPAVEPFALRAGSFARTRREADRGR
jgi:hypothetical protein